MLLLHLPVALHDTRAALQAVVEVRDVHELRVVVHEHFLFVNLQKAGTQSLHDGAGAGVVAEGKQAVGLVEGWLVAVPHLEALLVPAHHRQALLKLLHIPSDIRNLDLGAADNQATGKVDGLLRVGLLDKLVAFVEGLSESVVNASRGQRFLPGLEHAV
jgi:hypothetical protein